MIRAILNRSLLPVMTLALIAGGVLYRQGEKKRRQHDAAGYQMGWVDRVKLGTSFAKVRLETHSGVLTLGQLGEGTWTWCIVSSRFNHGLLTYPGAILERFGRDKVRFVYATMRDGDLPAPDGDHAEPAILARDSTGDLERAMGLPSDPPAGQQGLIWYVLLNPNGQVHFSYPRRLPDDSIRQLTERVVGGGARYVEEPKLAAYSVGATSPQFDVSDVRGSAPPQAWTGLGAGPATIVFFRAHCTSCSVNYLLSQLSILHGKSWRGQPEPILIFSSSYDLADLKRRAEGLPFKVYRATAPVPQWEDTYASRESQLTLARVIRVDPQKRIVATDDFNTWLAGDRNLEPPLARGGLWRRVGTKTALGLGYVRARFKTP